MTIEEFVQLPDPPDGSQLELVKGEVVTIPAPKQRHGYVCALVASVLMQFVRPRKLGWVLSNDTGIAIERDPDSLRSVDVAFWSKERQPEAPADRYADNPPDLAVEVLSPTDSRRMIREKVRQYIDCGVRLVWLVDPEARTVTVYNGTLRGIEYDEVDTLDDGDVLPGFTCVVRDLME